MKIFDIYYYMLYDLSINIDHSFNLSQKTYKNVSKLDSMKK